MNYNLQPSPDLAEQIEQEQAKPRYAGMGEEKYYHALHAIALKRGTTFSLHRGDHLLLQFATTPINDPPTEMDKRIDAWHESEDARPLHEFLGWSFEEYEHWTETQIEPTQR